MTFHPLCPHGRAIAMHDEVRASPLANSRCHCCHVPLYRSTACSTCGPPLAQIMVEQTGLGATHNMPCATCGVRAAVLNINTGRYSPCWHCRDRGWTLIRLPRPLLQVYRWLSR